jgi:hypothetical protein
MTIISSIESLGFRPWYERELARSHRQLLLLLLSAVAMLGALEALFAAQGAARLLLAVCLLSAAGVGAWALRRYLFLLMRAEHMARQAVCPHCHSYARWNVEAGQSREDEPLSMAVNCKACGHRWLIAC